MLLLARMNNKVNTIQRWFCIKINTFLIGLYDRFRECSGVAEATRKIQEKQEINEKKVEIIDTNMPKLKTKVEQVQERNELLEDRVLSMINELNVINNMAINRDCESIYRLLIKYNFNEKMEK